MKIRLKGPFNQTWIDVETPSTTLGALLSELSEEEKAPVEFFDRDNNKVYPDCDITVNGQPYSVFPDGLNTRLNNNDKVEINLIILTGG
jgi:molybdopterin converting factor small subunit